MVGDCDERLHDYIIYHSRIAKAIAVRNGPDESPTSPLIRLLAALTMGPNRVLGARPAGRRPARVLANPESPHPMPPSAPPASTLSLFYSYSHKDEALRD